MKKFDCLVVLGGILLTFSGLSAFADPAADSKADPTWYRWRLEDLKTTSKILDATESKCRDLHPGSLTWDQDCVDQELKAAAAKLSNSTYKYNDMAKLKQTLEQASRSCALLNGGGGVRPECFYDLLHDATARIEAVQNDMHQKLADMKGSDPQVQLAALKAENARLKTKLSKTQQQLESSQSQLAFTQKELTDSRNLRTSCGIAATTGHMSFKSNDPFGNLHTNTLPVLNFLGGGSGAGDLEQHSK